MPLGSPIRDKIVKKVAKRMDKRGYPILRSLIDNSPLMQKIINSLLTPEVIGSEDFYTKIKEDLSNANRSDEIQIYSPFTHKERVENMKKIIQKSPPKNTIIYTKAPNNFKNEKKYWQKRNISTLKNTNGVDVVTREKIHEKAVIIGEDIAYFGSLNVLSRLQEEAGGDYMLRYKGPSAGDLIKNYKLEMS